MARPIHYYIDIGDADPDGIYSGTPTGTGTLVLSGALVTGGVFYAQDTKVGRNRPGGVGANLDKAPLYQGNFPSSRHWGRRISIKSSGDDSSATFTITGENQDGFKKVEVVAGTTSSTVTSTTYFRAIESIVLGGTPAGSSATNTIGTVDEMMSPTIMLDDHVGEGSRTNVVVDITGTINYTVNQTVDPVLNPEFLFQNGPRSVAGNMPTIKWLALQAAGANDSQNLAVQGASGLQIVVNSYTNGAELNYHITREVSD